MIRPRAAGGYEVRNPAAKLVNADGVLFVLILPILNFHVADFVCGEIVGKVEELDQCRKRHIDSVVNIDGDVDGDGLRCHHWHAVSVMMGVEADFSIQSVEIVSVNGDGGLTRLQHLYPLYGLM